MAYFSASRLYCLAVAVSLGLSSAIRGQEEIPQPRPLPASAPHLPAPPGAGGKPYPINLPTALKLGNARGLDIELASRRLQVAAAQLQGAKVLWLPNLLYGTDYYRHDGQIQDIEGHVFGTSKQGFIVGGAPYAVFALADAIFSPLAVRQTVRARQADVQAAANDSLWQVAQAYFNVQQSRGALAGTLESVRFADDLKRRLDQIAPGLTPALEINRARTLAARLRQAGLQNQNNWRAASAELLRVLYLDPTLVVEPVEPPHLQVSLLRVDQPVDDLIPVALTHRPELAAQQALVQATLRQLKQEKMRPLVPSVLLRGFSTPVTGTLGFGYFGGGVNSDLSNFGMRQDWDIQAIWTLQNFGLGNRALIHQRVAENKVAVVELFRVQDRVAAEVVQAHALAQTAAGRVQETEVEVKDAQELVRQSLALLGQTKQQGAGGSIRLVVNPADVVAAIQMLQQAYSEYYAAIGDSNRAQFQLYRALGQPAQELAEQDGCRANGIPSGEAIPSADSLRNGSRQP